MNKNDDLKISNEQIIASVADNHKQQFAMTGMRSE